jgi:hypothetical protein
LRPKEEFFDGTRLVIATPDGFRTLVEASVGIFEPKMSPDGSRIAYQDGDSIYVVEASTGESLEVAVGRMAAWLDDDTLIVAPTSRRGRVLREGSQMRRRTGGRLGGGRAGGTDGVLGGFGCFRHHDVRV